MINLLQQAFRAVFVLLLLAAAPGRAAEAVYDLARLTEMALAQNRSLLAARHQAEAAAAGVTSAGAFPNPELEMTGGDVRPRLTGPVEGRSRSVWLTQRLDYPWVRRARLEAAEAAATGAQAERRAFEVEVLARLKYRFHEVLRRQAEQKAAAEDLALMEQINQRVGLRVKTGEAPRYEGIKAEAELLNAQKLQQSAALRVAQAKAALRVLVGDGLEAGFDIRSDVEPAPALPPLETLRAELRTRNPELAGSRAATRRAESQLDHERSLRWPSLAIKGGYDQDPEIRNTRIGLVMTLPLWDWRRGPVAEAGAQLARARSTQEEREFALLQDLEGAWQQYQIAATQVASLESGILRQAESALKVAEAAYRFGERGILDYLDAQRVFRAARNELISARFELQAAVIDIERLLARFPQGHIQ